MKKFRTFKADVSNFWLFGIAPVLAIVANLVHSEVHGGLGFTVIVLSIVFLVALLVGIIIAYNRIISEIMHKTVYPRFEVAMNQPIPDGGNYEYLFENAIITDKQLSEYERNGSFEEIWLVSNNLSTEIDGGLYADIVPENLKRGIKYKIFMSPKRQNKLRLAALKKKHRNSSNVEYFVYTEEFFFLASNMDIVIYNPYQTGATGRRGYIGLGLIGGNELYEVRISDELVEAIASKLLEYIEPDQECV